MIESSDREDIDHNIKRRRELLRQRAGDGGTYSIRRVRVEPYCGGRLLKFYEQVEVPDFDRDPYPSREEAEAATRKYRAEHGGNIPTVDGAHYWELNGQRVAEDVARAMLAKWPQEEDVDG
jgi:hypothetical protein